MRTDPRALVLFFSVSAPSCMLTATPPPLVVDCAATPDSAERYPDLCGMDAGTDAGADADVDAGP